MTRRILSRTGLRARFAAGVVSRGPQSPRLLRLCAEVLAVAGHDVRAFREPAAALAALGEAGADVLVSDFRMAEMSGEELLGRVRRLAPGLPALMMSGGTVNRDDARGFGFTAFLAKPFTPHELAAAVLAITPAAQSAH